MDAKEQLPINDMSLSGDSLNSFLAEIESEWGEEYVDRIADTKTVIRSNRKVYVDEAPQADAISTTSLSVVQPAEGVQSADNTVFETVDDGNLGALDPEVVTAEEAAAARRERISAESANVTFLHPNVERLSEAPYPENEQGYVGLFGERFTRARRRAAVAASLLVLAACSGGGDTSETTASTRASTTREQEATGTTGSENSVTTTTASGEASSTTETTAVIFPDRFDPHKPISDSEIESMNEAELLAIYNNRIPEGTAANEIGSIKIEKNSLIRDVKAALYNELRSNPNALAFAEACFENPNIASFNNCADRSDKEGRAVLDQAAENLKEFESLDLADKAERAEDLIAKIEGLKDLDISITEHDGPYRTITVVRDANGKVVGYQETTNSRDNDYWLNLRFKNDKDEKMVVSIRGCMQIVEDLDEAPVVTTTTAAPRSTTSTTRGTTTSAAPTSSSTATTAASTTTSSSTAVSTVPPTSGSTTSSAVPTTPQTTASTLPPTSGSTETTVPSSVTTESTAPDTTKPTTPPTHPSTETTHPSTETTAPNTTNPPTTPTTSNPTGSTESVTTQTTHPSTETTAPNTTNPPITGKPATTLPAGDGHGGSEGGANDDHAGSSTSGTHNSGGYHPGDSTPPTQRARSTTTPTTKLVSTVTIPNRGTERMTITVTPPTSGSASSRTTATAAGVTTSVPPRSASTLSSRPE